MSAYATDSGRSLVSAEQGLYEEGRFIVITPALNRECQNALRLDASELTPPRTGVSSFQSIPFEQAVAALSEAGADQIADRLTEPYLDFAPVHAVLAASSHARERFDGQCEPIPGSARPHRACGSAMPSGGGWHRALGDCGTSTWHMAMQRRGTAPGGAVTCLAADDGVHLPHVAFAETIASLSDSAVVSLPEVAA